MLHKWTIVYKAVTNLLFVFFFKLEFCVIVKNLVAMILTNY